MSARTSDQDKAAAVDRATELIKAGESATSAAAKVAESLDVSGRTVLRWADALGRPLGELSRMTAPEHTRIASLGAEAARDRIRIRLAEEVDWMLDRMRSYTKPREWRDIANSVALFIDKMRLEEGKSTSRQSVTVEQALSVVDAEIERLTEEMNAR